MWSSTPIPPQLGNSAGPVSTPSQPGGNAGRAGTQSQAGSVSSQAGSTRLPQPGRSAGSAGAQSQEDRVTPRQTVLVPLIQEGVQTVQVLSPRQAVVAPQLGRSTCIAGAHFQTCSVSPPRRECWQFKHSFPGRQPPAQE